MPRQHLAHAAGSFGSCFNVLCQCQSRKREDTSSCNGQLIDSWEQNMWCLKRFLKLEVLKRTSIAIATDKAIGVGYVLGLVLVKHVGDHRLST